MSQFVIVLGVLVAMVATVRAAGSVIAQYLHSIQYSVSDKTSSNLVHSKNELVNSPFKADAIMMLLCVRWWCFFHKFTKQTKTSDE